MRWTLVLLFCLFSIIHTKGQKYISTISDETLGAINIGIEEVNRRFTPSNAVVPELKSATSPASSIIVTYVNFPEEAKNAFEYAVSIWERYLTTSVSIQIEARWEEIDGNVLAYSKPSGYYKNFDAAPVADVYYPTSLAEKLSDKQWNNPKEADIVCSFNGNKPWYFGTDGATPSSNYDFTTAVLHEISHGLGISGFLTNQNGAGVINNTGDNPSIYDYFVYNAQHQRITDITVFKRPSAELLNQLTSEKLNLLDEASVQHPETVNIYAPSMWQNGASIYHFNESSIQTAELMSPYLKKGEAIHDPGENTLAVLSALGWNANSVEFTAIPDREETGTVITVKTQLNTALSLEGSSVKIIYSTSNFTTADSTGIIFVPNQNLFEAKLQINNYKGKVKYYFVLETNDNKLIKYPQQAPDNLLSFSIGPDYYAPELKHNPSKLVSSSYPELTLKAEASDNLGIKAVQINYSINGLAKDPIKMDKTVTGHYAGTIIFPENISSGDKVEYRIIAEDSSSRENKKILPNQGFYQVEVYESFAPKTEFYSDFEDPEADFTYSDFSINTPSGFSNSLLHTKHPYPVSEVEGDKYNLIAQLNHPIIIQENGVMTFDEIVLVEPGTLDDYYQNDQLMDYVIVEGSKDQGKTWHRMVNAYNSEVNEDWQAQFTNALKSTASVATGHENMFWEQSINLTENSFFTAGDTIIIRFRLSSDSSVNGWGWAIDNLNIQSLSTGVDDMAMNQYISIYPNPCSDFLYIDCSVLEQQEYIEVDIIDISGKTIYHQRKDNLSYDRKLKIDLSNIKSGMYLTRLSDSKQIKFTQKFIKN